MNAITIIMAVLMLALVLYAMTTWWAESRSHKQTLSERISAYDSQLRSNPALYIPYDDTSRSCVRCDTQTEDQPMTLKDGVWERRWLCEDCQVQLIGFKPSGSVMKFIGYRLDLPLNGKGEGEQS